MKEILQLNGIVFLTMKYEKKKKNPEEVYNGATHDNYRFFDKAIYNMNIFKSYGIEKIKMI